jgi:hypothetical protein
LIPLSVTLIATTSPSDLAVAGPRRLSQAAQLGASGQMIRIGSSGLAGARLLSGGAVAAGAAVLREVR